MPPKRKGRKGGDSDDDPLADQLKHLAAVQAADVHEKSEETTVATNSKKDKKLAKGGKQNDDDNEEEESKPSKSAPVKKGKHDDDEETGKGGKKSKSKEKEAEKSKNDTKAAAETNKKTKKGGKRNKYSDDEDSDDDKPKKAAVVESDEEDNNTKGGKNNKKSTGKAAPAPAPAPMSKKDKKKGNKGKNHDSSDDEDPLAKLKQLALDSDAEESEEESEEEKVVVPVKKAAPVPVETAKKGGKNDKKDNKSDKKSKNKLPTPPPSDDEEEEEEEEFEEEEEEVKPVPVPTKKDKGKKEKHVESVAPVAVPEPVVVPTPAPVVVAVAVPVPVVVEAPLPTPPAATEKTQQKSSGSHKKGKSHGNVEVVAPVAPVVVAPVVNPNRVKSKLELKLEKAKADKEAADAKAAEAAAAAAIVEAERLRVQKIEDDRLAAIAAAEAAEKEAARLAAAEEEDSSDDDDEDEDEEKDTVSKLPQTQAEKDAEARMMATMYGDEAFSEYNTYDPKKAGAEEDDEEETGTGKGKRGKDKLSNKAKRKLVKAAESKEREIEFNAAAMKASIEGAQFAVSQTIIDPNDANWQNQLDIIIPSVSISAHSKELFVNTELNIVHGRRYGLVGPNGAGKSTLLKMIAAGELKVPPRVDFLYVEQEVLADETPAVDAVLKADKVRWELVAEEKKISAALEKAPSEAMDVRLGEIHEQLEAIGAHAAESKARRILFGLGFDAEMQIRPTRYFSGGWRMRISLARALFIEPTLLMLDEPTNHLDLNAVIWLDDYLQKWKKTLLVVSHDQDFLNSVCQEVIHLDDKKLISYKGNYDNFKEQEAVKRKQTLKDYEKQEKKLRELKAKGVTKVNAEKTQLKAKAREPGARSKKQEAASMSSGGISSEDSQISLIARPRDYTVVFHFPEVIHLSPPILEVRDVNFQYSPSLPWLFKGLNFGLDMQSRVCIVGPNGSGKSTVIKLITEELKPPEGEVRRNPRLRVGVYNQHFVDRLPMEDDPVTYLRRLYSEETYQSVRNKLGKYGLEGHAHTIPIRDLSGGQKARVVFVELSLMAPHLLFLDEPTNNLDIESIDALCIALKEFNGGVVMVSHDARLIESTDCQLWVVEEQNVTPWASGFAGYREHLLKKLEEQLNAIMPGSGERPV